MLQEMDSLDTVGMEKMNSSQHQLVRYRPDGIGLVGLAQPTTTTTTIMFENTPRDNNVVLPNSPSTSPNEPTSKKSLADLPQELMDSIVDVMLPWIFSLTPCVPEDSLILFIDGADALEAAYSLHCIGFKLPTITVQWIEAVLAKQWKLRVLFDTTRLNLNPNGERKSRSKHNSLLRNFRTVIIPLHCGPNHIICKRLHYHPVFIRFHAKFRHGRWILDHMDWIGTAPSVRDDPHENLPLLGRQDIEEIARRALSSCGRTYFASGLVQRLLFRIEMELQPKTPIVKKKLKLTDLPQELIDKIMNESLPEKVHVAPRDSEALTLVLTLDDMTAIEVAYSLRSLGVKLPTPAEAWIQAIEAKKVDLVLDTKTSLIKDGPFNKEDYKGRSSILRQFKSVIFHLSIDHPDLYPNSPCNPGFDPSLHLKFRHGRWVLKHTAWLASDASISAVFELTRRVAGQKKEFEDIAGHAVGSCGKTCTAGGLMGRLVHRVRIENEMAEQALRARIWKEVMELEVAYVAKKQARRLAV